LTTIDHWSTMHPLQLKSPVDLSTNLAGQLPRFPAIFFVLAASSPAWGKHGASDWPAALVARQLAAKLLSKDEARRIAVNIAKLT
jgi:hypothetical protein